MKPRRPEVLIDPPVAATPVELPFPAFFKPHRRTPIMLEMAARAASSVPDALAGITLNGVIHLEDNALAFVHSMLRLGLDPHRTTLFAKGAGYRYGNKAAVIRELQKWGVTVLAADEITPDYFHRVAELALDRRDRLLFVEDGPFFGESLLNAPEIWPQVVGCLQQTTRGMPPYRNFKGPIGFPVLSLPDSELKKLKEPPFIGKTFMRGLSAVFPHREWTNQKIAIFGSGAIGRAVGDAASALCMRPASVDVSPRAQLLADNICGELATPVDAARDAAVIAGFSGGVNGPSITAEVLAAAPHGVIVASGSSERFEVELAYLNSAGRARPLYIDGVPRSAKSRVGTIYTIGPRAKEIVLVNDGWPLSFIGIPSTTLPDQLADFVMAMMLVGAIELGAGRFADRKGIVTFTDGTDAVVPAIDKLADEWGIPSSYLRYWRA